MKRLRKVTAEHIRRAERMRLPVETPPELLRGTSSIIDAREWIEEEPTPRVRKIIGDVGSGLV